MGHDPNLGQESVCHREVAHLSSLIPEMVHYKVKSLIQDSPSKGSARSLGLIRSSLPQLKYGFQKG